VREHGLGRPENVELLFRRGQRLGRASADPPGGGFKTKIDQHCDLVTMNVFCKSSRLKQHLKDGIALRIETVINSPEDLRCNRRPENLPELQDKARAGRYLAYHMHEFSPRSMSRGSRGTRPRALARSVSRAAGPR
jgi:hypothetical protein